jgi:hypothetical protein
MIGWSLTGFSVGWGLLAFAVFRRFTDRAALRIVRKRLYAHLLEIRLYSEEPALVWKAQKALLVDNVRFLMLTAKPILIMAVPFAFLYSPVDSIYGWRPIEVGHSAVVTLQMSREPVANDASYILQSPPGIAVETPPVRSFAEHQVSWRIRALTPVSGNLRVALPGQPDVSRSVAAGDRTLSFIRHRESSPDGVWMEVAYPRANVDIIGLSLPWLAWFLILSTASAALFTLWQEPCPSTTHPIPSA